MSPQTAPNAPGQLGEPIDVLELRGYLIALDGWLDARRAELEALDEAVRASPHSDDLTPDIALGLQLWQAIQNRYRRLLQVWDRGRVGLKEREQLASLVWGRLDEGAWGAGLAASGMSLPEACRMSDALTGQLRSRLQLDPAGTRAIGRLRDLRASMERLRDQVALEPPATVAARNYLAGLEQRLESLTEKAGRGGDIGGLLGPLEADAATFERDLIVGGVLRRQQPAPGPATGASRPAAAPPPPQPDGGPVAPQPAAEPPSTRPDPGPQQPGPSSSEPQAAELLAGRRERAGRLRADLIARGTQLDELVARVASLVTNPPKYAVPDVTAMGPVPQAADELDGYLHRLGQVSKAMDMVDQVNSAALHRGEVLANELIMMRAEAEHQQVGDQRLADLLRIADELTVLQPRPDEVLAALLEACRHYRNWLAETADRAAAPGADQPVADQPEVEQ